MKRLLIVEPGFREYKEPIVAMLADSPGIELYSAVGLPTVESSWINQYTKGVFAFSYTENDLVEKTRAFEAERNVKFDGALTYVDTSVHFVHQLQIELNLPRISLLPSRDIRGKARMRKLFANTEISQPAFCIIPGDKALTTLPDAGLAYPFIVKPSEMMSSLAVRKVKSDLEFRTAVILAMYADFDGENLRSLYGDISSDVLLEQFIDGPEYSVESQVLGGITKVLGVTEKALSGPESFDEVGHVFPAAPLDPVVHDRIHKMVAQAHSALQLQNTFTHIEFRIQNDQPYLIELNCRIGGDLISELVRLSLYPNLGVLLASTAIGEAIEDLSTSDSGQHAIKFLEARSSGIFVYNSIDHIVAPSIRAKYFFKSGDRFTITPGQPAPRLGYLIGRSIDVHSSFSEISNLIQPIHKLGEATLEARAISFELASPDDLSDLCEVEKLSWSPIHVADFDTISQRLQSSRSELLVARDESSGLLWGSVQLLKSTVAEAPDFTKWNDSAEKLLIEGKCESVSAYFIVSISVRPDAPKGLGTVLLRAVAKLARLCGVSLVTYGARFTALSRMGTLDTEQAFNLLKLGSVKEPSVQVGKNAGFSIQKLLPNYFHDPESNNFGILMNLDLLAHDDEYSAD